MSIRIDHQLREQITRPAAMFPVTFFCDELASIPDRTGPLHWHTYFEIATAERGVLDFQVGQQHVSLDPGDSIFINGNTLHGIKQLSGELPDPMPNIVFSGEVIAPESGEIYRKYIQPIARCETLPFVLFRQKDGRLGEVNGLIQDVYRLMRERGPCYEMAIQRDLSRIFEFIFLNLDNLPRSEDTRIQLESQVPHPKNALVYPGTLCRRCCARRDSKSRQCQPQRGGALLSHIYGLFSRGGAHSAPTSDRTQTHAGYDADIARDQLFLRLSFCTLFYPSISSDLRIYAGTISVDG